ncbi:MAG: DUF3048 domain-containing protein [Candidatus Saccharimonadales bacterium]
MNDDIRHPRQPNNNEDQNKKTATDIPEAEGFAAVKATRKPKQWRWPHIIVQQATKKQKIIGGVIIAVLLVGGGIGVYALSKDSKASPAAPSIAEKAVEPPKPTTEASKLTGEQIDPALNKRPITGVMIENSPDARPQAGIINAGVIYEAIAEGGITRFLCLYQQNQPDHIGPIRSFRPYYGYLLMPYDASIVHAGGSGDGLAIIRNYGLKDIDHTANSGAFKRVSDRYAPHNLYTSMAKLDEASTARGYTNSEAKSLQRKEEKPGQPIGAKAIDLSISSPLYKVHYDYDPVTNNYPRTMGGKPHTDHRSGYQIAPKVVVAIVMSYAQSGIYSVYETNGTGRAFIFQDGGVQQVNWSKGGEREQFTFTDEAGGPVALNAGQTWITLVKSPNQVTFVP